MRFLSRTTLGTFALVVVLVGYVTLPSLIPVSHSISLILFGVIMALSAYVVAIAALSAMRSVTESKTSRSEREEVMRALAESILRSRERK